MDFCLIIRVYENDNMILNKLRENYLRIETTGETLCMFEYLQFTKYYRCYLTYYHASVISLKLDGMMSALNHSSPSSSHIQKRKPVSHKSIIHDLPDCYFIIICLGICYTIDYTQRKGVDFLI